MNLTKMTDLADAKSFPIQVLQKASSIAIHIRPKVASALLHGMV